MPTIANYPMAAIEIGKHHKVQNALLIQIADPNTDFIAPANAAMFDDVLQLQFLDIGLDSQQKYLNNGGKLEYIFSDIQAELIAAALQGAFNKQQDVIVHCHAGICRSGAVTEAGLLMGFTLPDNYHYVRIPNTLVFSKLRKQLGFTFSFEGTN